MTSWIVLDSQQKGKEYLVHKLSSLTSREVRFDFKHERCDLKPTSDAGTEQVRINVSFDISRANRTWHASSHPNAKNAHAPNTRLVL